MVLYTQANHSSLPKKVKLMRINGTKLKGLVRMPVSQLQKGEMIMRTMTIAETREISGGWTVKCPICSKKVKVGFFDWLFSWSVKSDLSNFHAYRGRLGRSH